MVPIRANLNTPEYATLRVDLTGFQRWDLCSTKLLIEISCLDTAGRTIHTIIRTTTGYVDNRLPDAMARDLKVIMRILHTDKLLCKPSTSVQVVIHDYLSFLYLSKQLQPHSGSQRGWIGQSWLGMRKAGVPCSIELGLPEAKSDFGRFLEDLVTNSERLTPSVEMTGDTFREFMREQKLVRGF